MRYIWRFGVLLSGAVIFLVVGFSNVPRPSVAESGEPAKAYFAGGCFWCMEEVLEKGDGVIAAGSGYMGGTVQNPSYEDVSSGRTGHAESVEVLYDPSKIGRASCGKECRSRWSPYH